MVFTVDVYHISHSTGLMWDIINIEHWMSISIYLKHLLLIPTSFSISLSLPSIFSIRIFRIQAHTRVSTLFIACMCVCVWKREESEDVHEGCFVRNIIEINGKCDHKFRCRKAFTRLCSVHFQVVGTAFFYVFLFSPLKMFWVCFVDIQYTYNIFVIRSYVR